MTEIKKGDWVEVTPTAKYGFTGPGSIGKVVDQFEYARGEYYTVEFHIYCPARGNRKLDYINTFDIMKSHLKVIGEPEAMKKIAMEML